jgi:hypothetical protein
MNDPVLMTIPQMQEAAKYGAFIEFVGGSLAGADASPRMDRFADAIRKIGPEFVILSSGSRAERLTLFLRTVSANSYLQCAREDFLNNKPT